MEDRYRILATKAGGMGVVHIALDRGLAKFLQHIDQNILQKTKRINPDQIQVDEGQVDLGREDRLRLALYLVSGSLNTARGLRNSIIAAVKVIKPELSHGRAVDAFRYEASLWLKMSRHPNIVQLKEIILLPSQMALILEYVDGGSLSDLLARTRTVSAARALEISLDICRGMEYLHSTLHIVHRDLTPRNILLSLDGTAKVTDFGLAKAKSEFGIVGKPVDGGTPGYMSPEQQADPKSADERSDIYAFGVVLREMLSGRDRALAPKPPDPFDEILRKCLAFDREHRFGSFREVEAAIAGVASQMGVTFPVAAYPDLAPELSLLKWCQEVCANIESFPPRGVACDACLDDGGSIIRHSVLGAETPKSSGAADHPTPPREEAEQHRDRVVQWVLGFMSDRNSAIAWDAMANTTLDHRRNLSSTLSSEGFTFQEWYRRGMGLMVLGCFEDSLLCFERVISGVADDGLAWDPKGRTEYGPACLGKGLALIQLGRAPEAAVALGKCMTASFYPGGIEDSYLGNVTIHGGDDREVRRQGFEIEAVRRAVQLCALKIHRPASDTETITELSSPVASGAQRLDWGPNLGPR